MATSKQNDAIGSNDKQPDQVLQLKQMTTHRTQWVDCLECRVQCAFAADTAVTVKRIRNASTVDL